MSGTGIAGRDPLPEGVATLRRTLYPHLSGVANRWNQTLGIDVQ